MFGTLYTSASDFSTFSYPRSQNSSFICLEDHESSFERRYCPAYHAKECNDEERDCLLQRAAQLFVEVEDSDHTGDLNPCEEEDSENNDSGLSLCYPEDDFNVVPLVAGSFQPSDVTTPQTQVIEWAEEDPDADSVPDSDYDVEMTLLHSDDFEDSESLTSEALRRDGPCTRGTSARLLDYYRRQKHIDGRPDISRRSSLSTFSESSCSSSSSSRLPLSSSFALSSFSSTPITSAMNSRAPSEAPSATSSSSSSSSSSAFVPTSISTSSSKNPWKCPHCPWVQRTQRMPDFLRHQRSHFVLQSDWPCPNSKCGKSFARKDSLKRHLNNKATKCKRPSGYKIC